MLGKGIETDTGIPRWFIDADEETQPICLAPCVPLLGEVTDKGDVLDFLHSAPVRLSDAVT
jgi:hypothetical protein